MQDLQRLTFGTLVRNYRRGAQLTQSMLATQAGLSVYSISNIERGIAHLPRKATLRLLAQALHLDPQQTAALLEAASLDFPDKRLALPRTTTSPVWGVPFRRNPFFIGRSTILTQLHMWLHPEHSAKGNQSCTLSGIGGIGKTQTAIEYAYRYATDYAAIFWVQAETRETMIASLVTSAHLLDIPEKHAQELDTVVAAFSRWLMQTPGWLLIWDNVESPACVKAMVPATRHGSMLFTSRRQALHLSAHVLDLPLMTIEEGTHFLLSRCRLREQVDDAAPLPKQHAAMARDIAIAVDGLPLALDQAGAYIEATQCRLDEYLHLFGTWPTRLLAEREPHADHPASVVKTLTLAFTHVQMDNALASELLIVCAFLAPEEIPEDFFEQGAAHLGSAIAAFGTDRFHFQSAIKALLTYSLIQRHPLTHTITIHRLVQAVLRDALAETARYRWVGHILAAMSFVFPASENEQVTYWQTCKKLLPHALVGLELGEHWQTDATIRITLMNHVATYYTNLAQFTQAEQFTQRALQMSEQFLYPLHPLVIAASTTLGRLYKVQGRYPEAEALVRRAVVTREQLLGPDHPDVASSLNNLAILSCEQGKYTEAESLYVRALHIWEQTFGAEHPRIASAANNLADLYKERGEYEKAEPLFVRALHMWRHTLGTEHPKVALPLNNMAEMYMQQGRYIEAEALLLQALHLTEQGLGFNHLNVAHPLINLGDLYRILQRYTEADAMYQRALSIKQQTFATTNPQITVIQQKLADLNVTVSRVQETKHDLALVLWQPEID